MNYIVWTTFLVYLFTIDVEGIRFHLNPNKQKCLRDEVQAHQLAVIEFEIAEQPGHQIDFIVCILC